jgi:hypothetical protein
MLADKAMARNGKRWEEVALTEQKKRARGAGNVDIAGRRADSRSMMNATSTHKRNPQLVKTYCGFVIDPCAGVALRPLPGTQFECLGALNEFRPESEGGNPRIDLGEAARRISRSRKTLYGWIEKGWLRSEHGLITANGRHLINWPIFLEAVEEGRIGSCA